MQRLTLTWHSIGSKSTLTLAFDSVHERFVVVAELHPAQLALGLVAGLGRGRLCFLALLVHGVGDLLQHPERAGLVRGGAAIAHLRVVAAAWVTRLERGGERTQY